MTVMSFVAVVAPRTGKWQIFARGENLLQNGILHFVFRFVSRQKSR